MAHAKSTTYNLVATSDQPDLIHEIERLADKASRLAGFSEEERDSLAIAVTEIGNNAINHGNKRDPRKRVFVDITARVGEVRVVIRDEGPGFNPDLLSNPLDPENLLRESGRGVFIVRSLMDEVYFDFSRGGTETTLIKRRKT
ncbi:MAG: ATP-binding protein [candidate division KSB1 bacterium]|nr:ATP-binding protein [candidate division KSB1 bacterium]MDZ7272833.1 ATP-binding protein [candidate division KSB1 bacterium]MDZ7284144.1 ATP-binding protein [candidate division KSB1 bacterium]MDZ7297458.1 ATP-binding protein [candidate division KSB1 bacterium]MDZ7305594.1 ATP-binding protein [candidate division KSB1 bacterium]